MVNADSRYKKIFDYILNGASKANPIDFERIMSDTRLSGVTEKTRKKSFQTYIENDLAKLDLVRGYIPSAKAAIDLVESRIGNICERNVVHANKLCAEIVDRATRPLMDDFVRSKLSSYIDRTDGVLIISPDGLVDFLLDDFQEYMRAASNGLMSIAGSLNEKLLHRVLVHEGLKRGQHFSVTGTKSKADIVVHCAVGTRDNLGVEVKSYHARERLLRGLTDITIQKVGVGYFKDPSEFNVDRTKQYMQVKTAAIYMPQDTLDQLSPGAIALTTNENISFGSALYRPIEAFGSDMKAFASTGRLPKYRP